MSENAHFVTAPLHLSGCIQHIRQCPKGSGPY